MLKYEVTFAVDNDDGTIDHKWSAVYEAEDFAQAEQSALLTLNINKDKDSVIHRIERW